MSTIDYTVLIAYVLVMTGLGVYLGGRQKSATDFMLGGRHIPWWLACGSIVATETSILTVVGIPALSYGGDWRFLQLVFGYVVGRYAVAMLFLPRYAEGSYVSAYEWINLRLGRAMSRVASGVFIVTRVLADGVRVYAGAIVIQEAFGLGFWSAVWAMVAACTVLTILGGIRAVIWTDFIQLVIYCGGAVIALGLIAHQTGVSAPLIAAWQSDGLRVLNWSLDFGLDYTLWSGLIGGAVFTLASHGTDHIIVQRVLSCSGSKQARRAMIASGWFVLFQMVLFLLLGTFLAAYFGGTEFAPDGAKAFPRFIIQGMPPGVRGIMVAAIFSAAISTLSSSLSSTASALIRDFTPFAGRGMELRLSRFAVLLFAILFIGSTWTFARSAQGDVDLVGFALAIATMTYAGLLTIFLYGAFARPPDRIAAFTGFCVAVVSAATVKYGLIAEIELGWPWLTPLGALLGLMATLAVQAVRGTKTAVG